MRSVNEYRMGGMRIIPSAYVTVPVELRTPHTGDMTEMVDTLQRHDYRPPRKPGAYRIGDRLVVHPEILSAMQHQMQQNANDFFHETVLGEFR